MSQCPLLMAARTALNDLSAFVASSNSVIVSALRLADKTSKLTHFSPSFYECSWMLGAVTENWLDFQNLVCKKNLNSYSLEFACQ